MICLQVNRDAYPYVCLRYFQRLPVCITIYLSLTRNKVCLSVCVKDRGHLKRKIENSSNLSAT